MTCQKCSGAACQPSPSRCRRGSREHVQGTTTTFLARALVARRELTDLVVFANSTSAAHELEPAIRRFSVVLSGVTNINIPEAEMKIRMLKATGRIA